jgi:hypothetical protein
MVRSAVRLLQRQNRAEDARIVLDLFRHDAPGKTVSKGIPDFLKRWMEGGLPIRSARRRAGTGCTLKIPWLSKGGRS